MHTPTRPSPRLPRLASAITRATAGFSAVLAASFVVSAASLGAQDTTQRTVRLGLRYDPTTKPGIIVLPVSGPGSVGDSVRAIIQRDFDFGDRLNVVGQEGGFPESPISGRNGNYPVYAKLGAVALVQATVTAFGLHVAVHDVAKGAVARVHDFPLPAASYAPEWRLGVHGISDTIEQWITGVRGIAATRIAYAEKGNGRVWMVDSDGANRTAVTDGGGIALSPAWNPNGSQMTYAVQSARGVYTIMVHDVGGRARSLGTTPSGVNITPVFSPDGGTIVYSHGEEQGTDLFAVSSTGGGPARRITVGRGSENTSPTFDPNGRRIAFTSGRSGHPEIYISDADGTNVEVLTSGGYSDQAYRSDPDWSPDGRLVAFQSRMDGRDQVLTISLRDRTIRVLTSEGINEQPSWAPDSRHLVFASTRGGARQLWIMDIESGRTRLLTTAAGARLPAWSPSLQVP